MQQEILEKNPAADLRVYAVWLSMVLTDSRARWSDRLMPDPRVVHLWDAAHAVGRWFAKNPDPPYTDGEIAWDVYYLYDRDARWKARPAPLVSWGRTILRARDPLGRDASRLIGGRGAGH